ncbi:thylakoid lumenal 15 kDa protein 1, chloroplastic-like [Hibiscus syriacus]|uniref:thylakoid lumenal 15 kDa protein 1, chloroplastic-like n=1 Tax=Hibiscus syriacus TaxID=106335 RepID=UPI0019250276|nr:thylakoid lumenal 15 kDa protein 1, chloroplastic-like [Hibiscus syriacus]
MALLYHFNNVSLLFGFVRVLEEKLEKGSFSLGQTLSKASLLALDSASVFLVDPALAFKGGRPYGFEVTRGQDLTGKDFSGKTLIKQDFRTSILRQANFKGAKMLGASFFDADLTGADLSEADLRGADFSLANITKVKINHMLGVYLFGIGKIF